jgi:sulfatase modifying factor 1
MTPTPDAGAFSRGIRVFPMQTPLRLLRRLDPTRVLLVLAASTTMCSFDATATVIYEVVTVADPGNANDTTGYGGVAYPYEIGRFEVTIGQYCEFLNAIAQLDTHSLFHPSMERDLNIAGIRRSGSSGSYSYQVMGSPNRPITYVSWFDSARFTNWMANGQPTGGQTASTTEDGAYPLNGSITGNAPSINRINPNTSTTPRYQIPTENEWFKAAYYRGGGTNAGYWMQATQSNTLPGNLVGGGLNQANLRLDTYSVTQETTLARDKNYLTDVGAFTSSSSAYGTFDQCGNVYEWNDLNRDPDAYRGLAGGGWYYISSGLFTFGASKGSGGVLVASYEANVGATIGFRLASPVISSIEIDTAAGVWTQSQTGYPVFSGTLPLVKNGPGTLVIDRPNTLAGPTSVGGGQLQLAHTSALSFSRLEPLRGGTVAIASSLHATIGGHLPLAGGLTDVGNGMITVKAGLSTTDLLTAIGSGRGDGSWNGTQGVTSSHAGSSGGTRTVGWLDNGGGSVTFGFAAPGDTNLDWQLDIIDAANLVAGGKFDSGLPATWSEGDFGGDGYVDILDVAWFASTSLFDAGNYNAAGHTQAIAVVPEPSTVCMALAGLACGGYSMWRRRKRT